MLRYGSDWVDLLGRGRGVGGVGAGYDSVVAGGEGGGAEDFVGDCSASVSVELI